MSTYTVRDTLTGLDISRGCNFREAAHLLLTAGDAEYEIRTGIDGLFGYTLWLRPDSFCRKWYPTKLDSDASNIDKATDEIMNKVIANAAWFPERTIEVEHD